MNSDIPIYSVDDCRMLTLDKHHHPNGNLSVVEGMEEIPFDIRRVYYIYDVPGGEDRGGHAHKKLSQFIISASGSFDVTLDDGKKRKKFVLNRPYNGLLIRPGIWRELNNFSSGAVTLVLASELFDEGDYIRDYAQFLLFREEAGKTI